jgi:GNAT superfamily N-acetyltransferase
MAVAGTEVVGLRTARQDEADALSELALRSKAYWGYDAAFLAACQEDLRLRPQEMAVRRVRVAECAGRVLGFATLEGDPPDGELGMLFVEPDTIGGGVGRLLYDNVLDDAGRLGFSRLTIASDPYAEGFYLAMGAERDGDAPPSTAGALPRLVAWPRRPEPSWVGAWTGGRRVVLVGNVAEFNAQFGATPAAGPDHYSCLALFGSPQPAAVILPEEVDEFWLPELARELGWAEVRVYSGIAENGQTSEAIRTRPEILEHVRSSGSAVLPWGRTPEFERIMPSPEGVLNAVRRYESKAGSHALFCAISPGHPGITVPTQRPITSRRALARELASNTPIVLKSDYGVGGSGTLIVTAGTGRVRALARRWAHEGVLLEEYVHGSGPYRNPTFDAVIGAAGEVHPVGVGLMRIDGTSYLGVTVGPGVLPDALVETATGFGVAVGRALAADGYRGWYDVDFVTDQQGRLAPTETNLRLTGPAVAFTIQTRLDRLRGGRHLVRTLDHLRLGARLRQAPLRTHLERLASECQSLGATLLVTIPTAAFDPVPHVGVAIAARTAHAVDQAEAVVRAANQELGEIFSDLDVSSSARSAWWPRRRRPRPQRP